MTESARIYDFIVRQGTRAVLAPSWRRVLCHNAFFDLEHAIPTLQEKLLATFPPEALATMTMARLLPRLERIH